LNQLKSEKAKLLALIKIQFAKVQMCKEKLHDVVGGANGMIKAFQTIETTLKNVKGLVETRISHMVGFKRVSRMDKL
jgi:phage-related protein